MCHLTTLLDQWALFSYHWVLMGLKMVIGRSRWHCYCLWAVSFEVNSNHHSFGSFPHLLCHFSSCSSMCPSSFLHVGDLTPRGTSGEVLLMKPDALLSSDCTCCGWLRSKSWPSNFIMKHCASPVIFTAVAGHPPPCCSPSTWMEEGYFSGSSQRAILDSFPKPDCCCNSVKYLIVLITEAI